ncbi:MAG: hypothetical protein ABFS45_24540 [Pseudomonadota bacterium]
MSKTLGLPFGIFLGIACMTLAGVALRSNAAEEESKSTTDRRADLQSLAQKSFRLYPRPANDHLRRPDLYIEKYWVERDLRKKILYFNWLVRNVGVSQAAESTFTVTCKQLSAVQCPWVGGTYSRRVRALAPAKPGVEPDKDFAAGEVISLGMDIPTAPAKFHFAARIDSTGKVKEIEERNNHRVSEFSSLESGASSNIDAIRSIDRARVP